MRGAHIRRRDASTEGLSPQSPDPLFLDGGEARAEPELKIIDVFVCKLRKKLTQATRGENYIETVWGRGYVLRDPAGEGVAVAPAAAEPAEAALRVS